MTRASYQAHSMATPTSANMVYSNQEKGASTGTTGSSSSRMRRPASTPSSPEVRSGSYSSGWASRVFLVPERPVRMPRNLSMLIMCVYVDSSAPGIPPKRMGEVEGRSREVRRGAGTPAYV